MILDKIQEDLKKAQLGRDEVRVSTLRLLLSEVNNVQIAKAGLGTGLSEADIISVIQREAKKRRESIESFKAGNREDLVQKEEAELNVLQAYLPAQMSAEELTEIINKAITETGATGIAEMGKVMSYIMGKVAGRADGNMVSQMVKERLSK